MVLAYVPLLPKSILVKCVTWLSPSVRVSRLLGSSWLGSAQQITGRWNRWPLAVASSSFAAALAGPSASVAWVP